MNNPTRWVDPGGTFAICPFTLQQTAKYVWQMSKPYAYKAVDGVKLVGTQVFNDAVRFGDWAYGKMQQHDRWARNQLSNLRGFLGGGGTPLPPPPTWGNLGRAAEFGTKNYRDMRTALQGSGLQAHHIVDQRFGLNIDVTVALTRAEHQVFTNAMRELIPFGSVEVTKAQVWSAAQQVYANYPAILDAIRQALGF